MSAKNTNFMIDSFLYDFNEYYKTNIVRLSEYTGVHDKMKFINRNNNIVFTISYNNFRKSFKHKSNLMCIKKCIHKICSYNECLYEKAVENLDAISNIYINSNNVYEDISKFLNLSKNSVTHIVKYLDLKNKYSEARYNRIYNEKSCYNPFKESLQEPSTWWLLGYIVADGCIRINEHKIKKNLNICSIDEELIKHCCNILKIDYNKIIVGHDKRTINIYYSLDINDNNLIDSLIELGVKTRKSFIDSKINLDANFKYDFLRGLFDGDGCASKGSFSVIGHKSYMKDLHENYFQSLNYSETKDIGSLYVTSTTRLLWLYNKMYYKTDKYLPYLTRKKEKIYNKIKGLHLEKVTDLIYTDQDIHVCDINVQGAHTFFANNIYTHNCDFSAQELRLPALITGEPSWTEVFSSGGDLHKATAINMWGKENYTKQKRKMAKKANFGILYGMTAKNFAEDFKITVQEGEEFVKKYKSVAPVLFRWVHENEIKAKTNGTVYTMFGRPRRLGWYCNNDNWGMKQFGFRSATNTVIQGSGADILKISFMNIFNKFFSNGNMRTNRKYIKFMNTVHDEINYNVSKENIRKIVPMIISCMRLQLPGWKFSMDVGLDIGTRWGQTVAFNYCTKREGEHIDISEVDRIKELGLKQGQSYDFKFLDIMSPAGDLYTYEEEEEQEVIIEPVQEDIIMTEDEEDINNTMFY